MIDITERPGIEEKSKEYLIYTLVTGIPIFIAVWVTCCILYGFWGFVFGWIPALVLGLIFGIFWQITAILIVLGIFGGFIGLIIWSCIHH